MLNVLFSEKFISQFESFDNKIQNLAVNRIELFKKDFRNNSLKTHKLHGELQKFFSF